MKLINRFLFPFTPTYRFSYNGFSTDVFFWAWSKKIKN